MISTWTDQSGQKWEIKIDGRQRWHRRSGEGDDKWIEGYPPAWYEKAKAPLK
jgi:hypothetical protein